MKRLGLLTLVLGASLVLLEILCQPLSASAPVSGKGKVYIEAEKTLILYDSATKTEHLIWQGTFSSETEDFGVLIPTPTPPTLAEVHESIFEKLEEWTKPEVQVVRIPRPQRRQTFPRMPKKGAPLPIGMEEKRVEVLAEQRIAGMDITIFHAKEQEKLAGWLKKHGYVLEKPLADWLDRHIDQNWYLTAIQYKQKPTGSGLTSRNSLSTKAVRLTFQTEYPFYPYGEPNPSSVFPGRRFVVPKEKEVGGPGKFGIPVEPGNPRTPPPIHLSKTSPRSLRVFFVGTGRMGVVDSLPLLPGANIMSPVWAHPLSQERRMEVLQASKLEKGDHHLPESLWLSVIDINQYDRELLYFYPDILQEPLNRMQEVFDEVEESPLNSTVYLRWLPWISLLGCVLMLSLVVLTWLINKGPKVRTA